MVKMSHNNSLRNYFLPEVRFQQTRCQKIILYIGLLQSLNNRNRILRTSFCIGKYNQEQFPDLGLYAGATGLTPRINKT